VGTNSSDAKDGRSLQAVSRDDTPADDGTLPPHGRHQARSHPLQLGLQESEEAWLLLGIREPHLLFPELHGRLQILERLVEMIVDDLDIGVDPQAVQERDRPQIIVPARIRSPEKERI
jgi:hypothetical protein